MTVPNDMFIPPPPDSSPTLPPLPGLVPVVEYSYRLAASKAREECGVEGSEAATVRPGRPS